MKKCLSLIICSLLTTSLLKAGLTVTHLRCEFLDNPIGVGERTPSLEWQLLSEQRSQYQTAYQVLVASTPELLDRNFGDLWDSGKVPAEKTTRVTYAGKPLGSRQVCYWKVRVWDVIGTVSAWSDAAYWEMGLLGEEDWKAHWVGFDNRSANKHPTLHLPPSPFFRKEFRLGRRIHKATLYCTALGLYEAHLNGRKVGSDFFTPGWTDYDKRVYYQTYDVTTMLNQGRNAIGFVLANGWYAGYVGYALLVGHPQTYAFYGEIPVFKAQLEIEYENGEIEYVVSDRDWKVATGPILEADLLMGETYDARQEWDEWNEPGFRDQQWENCRRMVGALGKIEAYPGVPVQVIERLKPVAVTEPDSGKYIFDLGTNFAGIVQLKVKGASGTKIKLRYGEMLYPDGRLMTENLRKARATDQYILKGDPNGETWQPRFTYHGFQFVEVSGLPERPEEDAITGLVLGSVTPVVGDFECGHPLVNRLYRNITRTQRANFLEIPTDCPQRDERMGWTGDAQIYMRSATYNNDVGAFFKKWLIDLQDSQLGNGAYPNFAPFPYHRPNKLYAPGWMDAGIICTYNQFKVYDDLEVVNAYYDNMKALLQLYLRKSTDDLLPDDAFLESSPENGYGDWLNQDERATSKIFIANAYWLFDLKMMTEMAVALRKVEDAITFQTQFVKTQQTFLERYLKGNGQLKEETQTACAMALDMDILPEPYQPAVAQQLKELVEAADGRLSTGFLGVKHLLPALTKFGHRNTALELFLQTGFPSWLYEVENGATSIWERWDSYTVEHGFKAGMNSFSHYAFGSVNEWMFKHLAGIDLKESGFKEIIIRPMPNRALSPLEASYHSPSGLIRSAWEVRGEDLLLNVTIPVNTDADIFIPADNIYLVEESGRIIGEVAGIEVVEMKDNVLHLRAGSGDYRFVSRSVANLLAGATDRE